MARTAKVVPVKPAKPPTAAQRKAIDKAPFKGGEPAAKQPKGAAFKLPKTLGACADLLYELRQERLAAAKKLEEMEAREQRLKDHIIDTLPKSQAGGVTGSVARVEIVKKEIPRVEDWDKFYAHVKKTGDFELMGRGLAAAAIKERWEARKVIPGVGKFTAVSVSITKAKGAK